MNAWREVGRAVAVEALRFGVAIGAESGFFGKQSGGCSDRVRYLEGELDFCGRTKGLLDQCEIDRTTLSKNLAASYLISPGFIFILGLTLGVLLSCAFYSLATRQLEVGVCKGTPVDLRIPPLKADLEDLVVSTRDAAPREAVVAARQRARALRG